MRSWLLDGALQVQAARGHDRIVADIMEALPERAAAMIAHASPFEDVEGTLRELRRRLESEAPPPPCDASAPPPASVGQSAPRGETGGLRGLLSMVQRCLAPGAAGDDPRRVTRAGAGGPSESEG